MKTAKILLLAVGAIISLPSICTAEFIVGYQRLSGTPSGDTEGWDEVAKFTGIPFAEEHSFTGVVDTASGNVISVSDTPWSANEFVFQSGVQPRNFFVEVVSGNSAGSRFDITSNSTNSLTLNLDGGSLSGLAQGDELRIYSKWSLNLLFPAGAGITASTDGVTGTEILLPSGSPGNVDFTNVPTFQYRSDLSRWVNVDDTATDAGDLSIDIDALLVIKQSPDTPIAPVVAGVLPPSQSMLHATVTYDPLAAPEISIQHPFATELTSSSSTVDFGGSDVGVASGARVFTIRNTGDGALSGIAVQVAGSNPADFAAGSPGATTLNPGESTTVSVTFTPGDEGARSATLSIASNDADENPFTIALVGTGNDGGSSGGGDGTVEMPGDPADEVTGTGTTWTEEAAGKYAGLIFEEAGDDPAGWIQFALGKKSGLFSAKFIIEADKAQTVRGAFEGSPASYSGSFTKSDVTYDIDLDLEDIVGGKIITGTINTGGRLFSLRATQAVFSNNNPAPWEGKFTIILPRDPEVTDGLTQPLGNGYALASMSKTGAFRMSGKLGDGTSLSLSAIAGADGTLPFFKNLYRAPKGWIAGALNLRDVDNISAIDGMFRWVKQANEKEKIYPDGFAIDQPVIGSGYTPPAKDEQILSQLSDSINNAVVTIGGGGVAPLPELPITWTTANKVIYEKTGTESFALKFTTSSGAFSGRYTDKSTGHKISMKGAVLQAQQLAAGYFIGDGQAGWVRVNSADTPGIEVRDSEQQILLTNGSSTPSTAEGTDFGDAGFEGGYARRTFVITNGGDGDLSFLQKPQVVQSDSAFAVVASSDGILKTGQSTVIEVLFQPDSAGLHSADIAIYSNDRDANPFTFAVQGSGVAGSQSSSQGDSSFTGTLPGGEAPGVATSAYTTPEQITATNAFTGLVKETSAGNSHVGFITIKTGKGASSFSATLWYDDGLRYNFKNAIAGDGSATGELEKKSGDIIDYTLQLVSSDAGGDLRIAGTLDDSGRGLEFIALRTPYSSKNPLDEALQGTYTMLIPGNTGLGQNYPLGDGIASVKVSANGKMRVAGRMGDSKTISCSTFVSGDGEWLIYKHLYNSKPKGFVSGTMAFRDIAGVSDFDGLIQWTKLTDSKDKSYPGGFEISSHAIGSKFTAPESGFTILDPSVTEVNGALILQDPGINPNPGDIPVNWDSKNKLTFTQVGTETIRMSVSKSTGLINGTYSDRDNDVRAAIKAVVFQKQNLVGGHTDSSGKTGAVAIEPVAAP